MKAKMSGLISRAKWAPVGLIIVSIMITSTVESVHDYGDALSKSIIFFEGQRSGMVLGPNRIGWGDTSALDDGHEVGWLEPFYTLLYILQHPPGHFGLDLTCVDIVDLVGGYYDAGDNLKFTFPMAFTITMLAWSQLEFGTLMGVETPHVLQTIRWGTDYLLKATSVPGLVFVLVGDPFADHACWERPQDMDTPRTPYAVSDRFPGSEVSAEIAAALAASSMAFQQTDPEYAARLLDRAKTIFDFANKYRGSYNETLGRWMCRFYCDDSGYQDELLWAATWLYKATNRTQDYYNYVQQNRHQLESFGSQFLTEFSWDAKHAGVTILLSKTVGGRNSSFSYYANNADKFVCSVLPESPNRTAEYLPGGLLFKTEGRSNLQYATSTSFLLLVWGRRLNRLGRNVKCGTEVVSPKRLIQVAKQQTDYILGSNPLNMSFMVGYGENSPKRVHHRSSSIPTRDEHQAPIGCNEGRTYFYSTEPNPNELTGAVVGGPNITEQYTDSREDYVQSEPTTYTNAPLVGILAYFKSYPNG